MPTVDRTLLTPHDVHHKRFATVRLREGYDLAEVDTFLHEVEATLARLFREVGALRQQAAESGEPAAQLSGSDQAQRVLALADRTAGEVMAQASADATRIVMEAQSRAEETEREGQERATQIEQEARNRAAAVDQRLHSKQNELLTLHDIRRDLERKVAALRTLATEQRERLLTNLDGHFEAIERTAAEVLEAVPPQGRPTWAASSPTVPRQGVSTFADEPVKSFGDDPRAG
ncbi:DivIVA domain-containing protein [Streptomyces sp. NRRL S-1813]|uniref:DivIVA domain-containing protein n=1 Tax=Streptomyces sp. NRRL S-1813 TaxID=1463888 RepID=UPI00131C87A7|nr:DivIVA domain-containing protein [Streptomyces sp. NRRL S-1813]